MIRTQSRSGPRLTSHERHTKASHLAKQYISTKQTEENPILRVNNLFKMKKFSNVAPRTNTNMGKRKRNLNQTVV